MADKHAPKFKFKVDNKEFEQEEPTITGAQIRARQMSLTLRFRF